MPERAVEVVNEAGIHARPAAEIVKVAAKFKSEILVVRDDLEVNAKSIMGVMMLAAECEASTPRPPSMPSPTSSPAASGRADGA
jgi:phosphocarrier protein HPr